jgi:hypothetical protein
MGLQVRPYLRGVAGAGDDMVGEHVVGGPETSETLVLLGEDLGRARECDSVGSYHPAVGQERRRDDVGIEALVVDGREVGAEQRRNLHGYSVAELDTL